MTEERTRVYLIRHGQIQGHEKQPVVGHTDVDLTHEGRLQMERMAQRLQRVNLSAVYGSDLRRSAQGARRVAEARGLPVHLLEGLREMYFGAWEGMAFPEIQEQYPHELARRQEEPLTYRPPGGGESLEDFSRRVLACLREVLAAQKGRSVAVVAHAGVNRVILCDALGLDLERLFHIHQDYGCLNIIDYVKDFALVRLVNGCTGLLS